MEVDLHNAGFSLAVVATLVTIVGGFIGLWATFRKARRENEADARARTEELKEEFRSAQTGLSDRVSKLESKSADFMPRAEIERAIDSESLARVTSVEAQRMLTDRALTEQSNMRVAMGKLEQRMETHGNDMAEVKALVKEGQRQTQAGFEKLTDSINRMQVDVAVKKGAI